MKQPVEDPPISEADTGKGRGHGVLRLALKVAVTAILIAAGWFAWSIYQAASFKAHYDRDDPQYALYLAAFDGLRDQIRLNGFAEATGLDLAPLGNGSWQTACLFGGFTDPLARITELGGIVSDEDRRRLDASRTRGYRAAAVEEFEVMLATIGTDKKARFVHFERGFGPSAQHFHKCITKPETRILLLAG